MNIKIFIPKWLMKWLKMIAGEKENLIVLEDYKQTACPLCQSDKVEIRPTCNPTFFQCACLGCRHKWVI